MIKTILIFVLLMCFQKPFSLMAQSCSNYNGISDIIIQESDICNANCAYIEFNIIPVDAGSPLEGYDFDLSSSNGYVGYVYNDNGNSFYGYVCFNGLEGCEPVDTELSLDISCASDGSILDEDVSIGTVTIYPWVRLNRVSPGCGANQNGEAYLYNQSTGEVCSDVINGGAGNDNDCAMPGTLFYSFELFADSPCSYLFEEDIVVICDQESIGCTDPSACNYDPTAACDDGSCILTDPCCPRPLTIIDIGSVCSGLDFLCIQFDGDIDLIDYIYINSYSGYAYGNESSRNGNEICFDINYDVYSCAPMDEFLNIQYYCTNGESIFEEIATVTIYPYLERFVPNLYDYTDPCDTPHYLRDPNCGTLLSIEDIPPSEDCDNISYGTFNWVVDPGFDITDAPSCFVTSGSIPYIPCLEDCSCNINYEGVEFEIYNENVCYNSCSNFQATIITDIGPTDTDYIIEVFGSDESQSIDYMNDTNTSDYIYFCFDEVLGCDPVTVDVIANILCADGSSLIEEDVIVGTFIVYPELDLYYEDPGCITGENGMAYMMSPDGSICSEVIMGTSGATIDCDNNPSGILNGSFLLFEGTDCETTQYINRSISCFDYITGCTDANACNYNPEAECEDGSCIISDPCCPAPILSSIPSSICNNETMICFTFDADVTDINYVDLDGNYFSTYYNNDETSGNPNEVCLELYLYSNECVPISSELSLSYQCTNGEYYTIVIPDEMLIYPRVEYFTPQLYNSGAPCSYAPFLSEPSCINSIDIIDTPPISDCDNPQVGTFDWSVDPGFDVSNAPACFIDALSGTYEYPPCLEDCPCETNFVDIVFDELIETHLCNNRLDLYFDLETLVGSTGTGYHLEIEGSDGSFSSSLIYDYADSRTIYLLNPEGCDPIQIDLTANIYCEDMTTLILQGISIGMITLYPDLYLQVESPGCEEGDNGIAYLTNVNGEICSEQITGTAGEIIDCDTSPNAMLQYNFVIFEGTPCEYTRSQNIQIPCFDFTTGCTDPDACNFDPLAECDDGSCLVEPCCPLPVSIPTTICGGVSEICIEFDQDFTTTTINYIRFYTPGGVIFTSISSVIDNTVCVEYSLNNSYQCFPLEGEVSIEYQCSNGEDIDYTFPGNSYIIYPSPFAYDVSFRINPIACQPYEFYSPNCGIFEYEEVIPELDCNNPQDGMIEWTITPAYDTIAYPDCPIPFTGSINLPVCLEDCPCDGAFCTTCSELELEINLPEVICSNDYEYFDLDVTGAGAIDEGYYISFYVNGVSVDVEYHYPGQPSNFEIRLDYANNTCYPVEEEIQYILRCLYTDEIMFAGNLGTVTIYPDGNNFTPRVIHGFDCGYEIVVYDPPCGTLIFDEDMISNACDITEVQYYTWEVTPDFDIEPSYDCLTYNLSGDVYQYPCDQEQGDICYSDCFGAGVIDDNCNCVFDDELPMISYDGPSEFHICQYETIDIEINFDPLIFDNIRLSITNNSTLQATEIINSNSTNPAIVSLNIRNAECKIESTSLYAEISCRYNNTIIQNIYIGELYVYPDQFNPEVEIFPADCGEVPEVLIQGCGDYQITNIVDPINDPNSPIDGYIEYTIYPEFDVENAPECISYEPVTGTTIIEACDFIIPPPACSSSYQSIESMVVSQSNICGGDCVDVSFDIIDGGDVLDDTYSFEIFTPDGPSVEGTIIEGQGYAEICFDEVECILMDIDLMMSISCDDFLLEEDINIGSISVYPSLSDFVVQITPSVECGEQPLISSSGCGSLVIISVIPPVNFPDSPVTDGVVEYTFDFGFDLNEAPNGCYDMNIFSGSAVIPACTTLSCDADNGTLSIKKN